VGGTRTKSSGSRVRTIFAASAISFVGDGMVLVALAFAALQVTGSPTGLGLVLAVRTTPTILLVLIGGAIADRYSRRRLMIGADLARFVVQGLTAALLLTHEAELWSLCALQALGGAASAFFNPATTALVQEMVPSDQRRNANALRTMALALGRIAGPALAGVLISVVDLGWTFAIDALTFAASAALLCQLPKVGPRGAPRPRLVQELKEGWSVLRAYEWVWTIVLVAGAGNMLATAFYVLGPVLAEDSLGGPGGWATIVAAVGVGSALGAAVSMRLAPRGSLVVATAALGLDALPRLLLAGGATVEAIAGCALAAAAGVMLFETLWETALQDHIPAGVLARVSSYDWLGSLVPIPIGYLLVGPVAAAMGASTTLWIAGVAQLVVVAAALATGGIRAVGDRPRHRRINVAPGPAPARVPEVL
jgi:MFS family permease